MAIAAASAVVKCASSRSSARGLFDKAALIIMQGLKTSTVKANTKHISSSKATAMPVGQLDAQLHAHDLGVAFIR